MSQHGAADSFPVQFLQPVQVRDVTPEGLLLRRRFGALEPPCVPEVMKESRGSTINHSAARKPRMSANSVSQTPATLAVNKTAAEKKM
jgi:hypothetical protein